jgi:hypothetical protein
MLSVSWLTFSVFKPRLRLEGIITLSIFTFILAPRTFIFFSHLKRKKQKPPACEYRRLYSWPALFSFTKSKTALMDGLWQSRYYSIINHVSGIYIAEFNKFIAIYFSVNSINHFKKSSVKAIDSKAIHGFVLSTVRLSQHPRILVPQLIHSLSLKMLHIVINFL